MRTLILKGSDSQQRTTEIYVPSSNIVIRRFHAQTPGVSEKVPIFGHLHASVRL